MTMNRYDYELAAGEKLAKKIINIDGVGVNFTKFILIGRKTAREN